MNWLKNLVEVGLSHEMSSKEKKRVRLLNTLSAIFVMVNFILGALIVFLGYEIRIAYVHFLIVPLQVLIVFLQYLKKYFAAKAGFWFLTYISIFYFSFFGDTNVNNEYYFSILALLPLIFFDQKWIHWTALFLSCFGFMFMDFYYLFIGVEVKHMNNSSFVLFTLLFLIVNFFKNLNEKQEELLSKQRDQAIEQTKLIEKQNLELEELNRFQSKFFVNISHELKTPLTLIGGVTYQLTKGSYQANTPEIETLKVQTDKIKQIVDNILDISKSKFNKLELNLHSIDLNQLVKKIYSSFLAAFEEKKITLQLIIPYHSTFKVSADIIYLERALNNILLNSLKYTPENGKVHIEIYSEMKNSVFITVSDNGIGIKKEDVEKIFDRFFQSDNHINKSGGTGIGLSFARDIVKLHNGNISIRSEEDHGTTVLIELPCDIQKSGIGESETVIPLPKSLPVVQNSKDRSILIVDDHSDMRNYIASLLPDYNILFAKDGKDGLKKLEENHIDFIITDYMMPVMDGLEFVREMKARSVKTPVLVLTARSDMEGKLDILRLGVDDYITKPFNQEELVIRINNALNNYLQRENYIKKEKIETIEIEDPFLRNLRVYITQRIKDTNWGIDDICSEFAISTSSLYRKIKSHTGLSTNDFIREIKLIHARELVETKKVQSLKELSFAVGFNKPTYFSNLYLNRFGKKPFENN